MKKILLAIVASMIFAIPACAQQEVPETLDERIKNSPACTEGPAFIEQWKRRLRMQEWDVLFTCGLKPDWHEKIDPNLRGSSITYVQERVVKLWINYADPDPSKVALHEMIHAKLNFAIAIGSPVTNEATTQDLTALIYAYETVLMGGGKKAKTLEKKIEDGK